MKLTSRRRLSFPAAAVRAESATAVLRLRAILFLLAAAVCLEGSAAAPSTREEYSLFAKSARHTILLAIQNIDIPLRSTDTDRRIIPLFWGTNLKISAKAVVEALKDAKDSITNRLGKDFGVAYASVVWAAGIPTDFADILSEGPWVSQRQHKNRHAVRGAVTLQFCGSQEPCAPELGEIGSMGCPCPTGAAAFISAATKLETQANCMVYYYPIQHKELVNPLRMSNKFKLAVAGCMQRDVASSSRGRPRPITYPIDLTTLASNVIWGMCIRKSTPPSEKFKAVAVIPATGEYQDHIPAEDKRNYLNTHFGVNSDFGHILVEHIQVLMAPGDSRPPANLFFVAAIPIA